MKVFAVVGFVVLAFVVWWPAGVALCLWGVWKRGSAKKADEHPTHVGRVPQQSPDPIQRALESATQSAELGRMALEEDLVRLSKRIQEAAITSLDGLSNATENLPAYHLWMALPDVAAMVIAKAHGDTENLLLAVPLLTEIDSNSSAFIAQACADTRWKVYAGRSLGPKDIDDMQATATFVLLDLMTVRANAIRAG